jgi:putative pyruvate formate lyase activating enzyme
MMDQVIERCTLCPRMCGARREAESGQGACGMGTLPRVARAALHRWEEPCISGERGSGTVFFSGCALHCVFCQNEQISGENFGAVVTPSQLAGIYRSLVEQGAHNLNLVTPSHFAPAVAESLTLFHPDVPVVYNCGGYERAETLRLMEGLVDVYLPDYKYAAADVAARYSRAPDYPEAALAAIDEMVRQTGAPQFDKQGMLVRGTLVRHLVLPGNTRNAMAVLDTLAAKFGGNVLISLMGQYVPCGRASEFPELGRRITKREYKKVEEHLMNLGLDGYVQELASASKCYIPPFNLEGVPKSPED